VPQRSITSAADFLCVLARCIGGHSENVAGRWLNVLSPWRGRSYRAAQRRRDEIWQHSRGVQLPIVCVSRHLSPPIDCRCDLMART
jgi:hypothetical protein